MIRQAYSGKFLRNSIPNYGIFSLYLDMVGWCCCLNAHPCVSVSLVRGLRKIPQLSHLYDICIVASLSLSLSQQTVLKISSGVTLLAVSGEWGGMIYHRGAHVCWARPGFVTAKPRSILKGCAFLGSALQLRAIHLINHILSAVPMFSHGTIGWQVLYTEDPLFKGCVLYF